jgi:hypothetical protein
MHVRPLTGRALRAAVPYPNQNACTAIVNILIQNKNYSTSIASIYSSYTVVVMEGLLEVWLISVNKQGSKG